VLGQTPSVWHRDAIIQDFSGTVTLTDVESTSIMNSIKDASKYLKGIDSETFSWLEKGND
jgi:hypothetical protein